MNTKAGRVAWRGSPTIRKSKTPLHRFAFALGVVALLTTGANAQEVFRSSRPNYTRSQFRPNTSSRPDLANSSVEGGSSWVPRTHLRPSPPVARADRFGPVEDFEAFPPRPELVAPQGAVAESRSDFERVRSAWENYRREAIRYQARYGDSEFAANSFGSRRADARDVVSTPWRTIEDDASRPEYNARAGRLPPARNASLRPNLSQQTRGFGCRGNADQRPRLSRDVPVLPYREDTGFEFDDSLRGPSGEFDGNVANVRPTLRPSTHGSVRRSFPPNAPFQEDFRSERNRNFESRTLPSRDARSRNEVSQPSGRLFSTPVPKFDPAKLASRASDFLRTNLSE